MMGIFIGAARTNLGKPGFVLCLLFVLSCSQPVPAPEDQRQPVTHVIEIKGFKFKPQTLVVRSGDFVRWENKDIVPHQIAEETLKKWRSEDLRPQDSFTLQIKDSTSYICKLHPIMQAEIIAGH